METYINFKNVIRHIDKDGLVHFIPKDIENTDYQRYLSHEQTQADLDAQTEHDAEESAKIERENAEAEAKAQTKAILLGKLGITEDEAKLLLS